MRQLYTLAATMAAVAGVIALHPTFIPDGGILQSLTPVLLSFIAGTFATMAVE